ncbi:YlxQ family RNA-binding protein [Anaerobacillus alkaliphilus]|uniref:YlxQ family RNA-binding protein n=1 Tax=Anaerobacillus alkaliphilus TaxID=1548597 RepID=A0A4Q0VP40_9BACI|nr:YlxQ family RNA-binding protein [Anaerobacillus alkaliphilus]RXI97968.1 YlxQ family RNA-binding protein [Anaerobacillus alkaliphilus]
MKQPQWFSLLGLAARARKLVTGEELVIKSIRKKEVHLVIVADDASDLTKKKLQDKCQYYNVTLQFASDRGQLGAAIGKHERVVIGVTDEGFAQKLLSLL